jgi:hypothetical protein
MRSLMNGRGLLRFALAGLLISATAEIAGAETTAPPKVRLDAFPVNLSGIGRASPRQLQIVINRWSSEAEHDQLLDVLKNKGSNKLLDALQAVRPRAGYIRTTTSLGWDIEYARETPLPDGGRRIVFATDRPMSFFEMRNQTRSSEYQFMLAEIRLGKDGTGEGKLAPLAKISWDKAKDQLEIENYGFEPVRLTRVEVEKDAVPQATAGGAVAGAMR